MLDHIDIRRWKILDASYSQMLEAMDAWRKDGGRHYACFCDGNGLPLAWRRDDELRAAYAGADAVCADGIAVAALARLHGGDGRRLTGPEIFARALEFGVPRGWRHFFYGTDASTLAALKANVERRWPGARIVGTFAPEFSDDPQMPPIEKGAVDFLWVSLGCPKQEKWCARHKDELAAPVLLPVGAAFDFLAGTAREAPRPLRALGLNWLWRLLTGGRRIFLRNARCVSESLWIVMLEFARAMILGRRHG